MLCHAQYQLPRLLVRVQRATGIGLHGVGGNDEGDAE
jgi:hypothetical protein